MKKLSKDEIKKVMGGYYDDFGDAGDKQQKCCPKGDCNSSACSTCVTVPKGSHADCSDNPNAQVCDC